MWEAVRSGTGMQARSRTRGSCASTTRRIQNSDPSCQTPRTSIAPYVDRCTALRGVQPVMMADPLTLIAPVSSCPGEAAQERASGVGDHGHTPYQFELPQISTVHSTMAPARTLNPGASAVSVASVAAARVRHGQVELARASVWREVASCPAVLGLGQTPARGERVRGPGASGPAAPNLPCPAETRALSPGCRRRTPR